MNLDLVLNKRIVQAWRGSDWPKGHYSIATFSLKRIKRGTRLVFTQIGVPDREHKGINQGWRDFYWKPLKAMLEK
jgi:activator of HSP90 ATPase